MSLSLLITINVLADVALLAGLAWVMSRAARLQPHVASAEAPRSQRAEHALAHHRRPSSLRPTRADVALDRASQMTARQPVS
jgi:hypothetical protein